MARNQHSFAKRQREIEKKRKADEKRERRRARGKAIVADDAETPNASQAD